MDAKKLRAKAINTIGSIITSVSENEDKEPFKANVLEITQHLATLLQSRLSDDDPQDESIKDTLAQCAGFLGTEFVQFMPMLLEQLIVDAQLDLDFKMESVDMPTTTDNMKMKVKDQALVTMVRDRHILNDELYNSIRHIKGVGKRSDYT